MAIPAYLVDVATGKALHSESYMHEGEEEHVLLITTIPEHYGVFKSQKFTATGTIKIAEPEGNGSIRLSDLMVSFEKKTLAEVTIQFNDGANTELVWFGDMQDAPISFGISFTGKWQGWRSAWVEVVVAGAALDGSVGIGYIKHNKGDSLPYNEWNSRR